MSEVDGATLIARSLKQQGIDHLFGVVGFPVGPIAAAAQKEGVAYIGMRNEQAASYAAQAYGYLTGRPGACIVVTGPGVVHGLAGLANAQQNCWPMILIGGASETYRGGMGAFQEERQVLIASPFCKFAHGIESVRAHPLLCRDGDPERDLWPSRRHLSRHARRHHHRQVRARQGRPGRARARPAAHGGAGGEHRGGAEPARKGRAAARPRRQGHGLVARRGRGARLHRAHASAVPALADGQGRDAGRPSAVGRGGAHLGAAERRRRLPDGRAASTGSSISASRRAIAKDVKVIQLDIAPEEIGHNKPTEVALVGDGKAIMAQLNKALANRQWFHPKDTPWRQTLTKKAAENAAKIKPQIDDDEAPANYYRALRDVAAWMPKNAILSAEGAGTMDIGLTQLPMSSTPGPCLNAGTYGTMGVGLGQAIAAAVAHPDRPVIHLSGNSAIGFSGMEMETLVRYNLPVKIVVLNNGGIGPGMPEIPENPMFNLKPNALIYGARYDRMMEAFGGKGFFVEDPKDITRRPRRGDGLHAAPPWSTSCSRRAPPASRSSSAGTADGVT